MSKNEIIVGENSGSSIGYLSSVKAETKRILVEVPVVVSGSKYYLIGMYSINSKLKSYIKRPYKNMIVRSLSKSTKYIF